MLWTEILLPLTLATFFVILPGFLCSLALGLKGFNALATATGISISIYSVSSIILSYLNITWNLTPVLIITAIIATTILVIRKTFNTNPQKISQEPWCTKNQLTLLSSAALGGAIIFWQLKKIFVLPENFSQTFDNVFHLNAIRYIQETGTASPFTISSMTNNLVPDGSFGGFYPTAWHSIVALIFQNNTLPIGVAPNIFAFITAAIIWPLSCIYFIKTIKNFSTTTLLISGIMLAGFTSFPILLIDWGVLYPNLLGYSLLPLALGIAKELILPKTNDKKTLFQRYLLFLSILPGLGLSHPNTLITLLLLIQPLIFTKYFRYLKQLLPTKQKTQKIRLATLFLTTNLTIFIIAFLKIRPPVNAGQWLPFQSDAQAIGEIALNTSMSRPAAWVISIMVGLGIFYCLKNKKHIWLLSTFATTAVLYVWASATLTGNLRDLLLTTWYKDSYRLAALLPIATIPLATIGTEKMLKFWKQKTQHITFLQKYKTVTAGIILVLTIFLSQGENLNFAINKARNSYAVTENSKINNERLKVLNQIAKNIPADSFIAVNAGNGGGFAYAISGINTTEKHGFTTPSPEIQLINKQLNNIATNPQVCQAVQNLGITHVLNFGTEKLIGWFINRELLITNQAGFKPIIQAGEYGLYEILPCENTYSIYLKQPNLFEIFQPPN